MGEKRNGIKQKRLFVLALFVSGGWGEEENRHNGFRILRARLRENRQLKRPFNKIDYKIAMRQPGIEPGSTAWKAAMLTTIPLTLLHEFLIQNTHPSKT